MHHAILIYGAAAAARPALLPKERVCLPYALALARRRVPLRRRCSLLLYYCGCDIIVCLYVALPRSPIPPPFYGPPPPRTDPILAVMISTATRK